MIINFIKSLSKIVEVSAHEFAIYHFIFLLEFKLIKISKLKMA